MESAPVAPPGRNITLVITRSASAGTASIPIELDRGRTYRLLAARPAREALIGQLADTGDAGVVAPDGGLIGNLKVWENLVLPVAWRANASNTELDARARAILGELGFDNERYCELCRALPENLSAFEARLAAFVRAMLLEPEIMVYDRLFESLSRSETEQASCFDALFRLRFPFRTSVFVDAEIASLAQIPAHRLYDLR